MSELTNIDTKGRFIVGDIIFNINTWWARVRSDAIALEMWLKEHSDDAREPFMSEE